MGNPSLPEATPHRIKTLLHINEKQVRLVMTEKSWLESLAQDQLLKAAQQPHVHIAVGMPDLHPGPEQPIGASFISKDYIYPHFVGGDIGCGMAFYALNQKHKSLNLNKLIKSLSGLDEPISPDFQYQNQAISEHYCYKKHKVGLGTIGQGNHFAEFQVIDTMHNPEIFERLGLDSNMTFLLIHSGSRGFGSAILDQHIHKNGTKPLEVMSEEGQTYLRKHDFANQWAQLNRALIAERFMQKIGSNGRLILDSSHNTVTPLSDQEKALLRLEGNYWNHRKGAAPSHGTLIIPGSRGSLSYLVQTTPDLELQALANFSLAHGAGRKWKRKDCKKRLDDYHTIKSLQTTKLGGRVICEDAQLLYEEAPEAYKNIHQVIDDLKTAGLISVIATLKPIVTYKVKKG